MTTSAPELVRLRPEPHPVVPMGPFRLNAVGEIERFRTEGLKVIRFIERNCVFTNGKWIGQPFVLLDWEKQLIIDGFELVPCSRHPGEWHRRYRTWYVTIGKKNGKTELVAAIGLYLLIGDGKPAATVLCAAAGEDQADLVFGAAATMAEMSSTLPDHLQVWEKEILAPEKPNTALRRLPASGGRIDGKNAYCSLCDELHEWLSANQEKTWGMLRGATAVRDHPLNINISTAGFEEESVERRLYDYGKKVESGEVKDETFFFRCWEMPDDWQYRDLSQIHRANPSFGVTVGIDFYKDELTKRTESEFRRYYGNQHVEAEDMWLPAGRWAECEASEPFEFEAEVETGMAWDASTHNDSTAILTGQWSGEPTDPESVLRVKARGQIWERPLDAEGHPIETWTLPIAECEELIRVAHRDEYPGELKGVGFDPAFITWSAASLEAEGVTMVKWPQTDSRMIPATKAAYELIINGRLEHDGDPTLARHVRSVVAVMSRSGGYRLAKAKTRKKIDGAIALVMLVALMMPDGEEEEDIQFYV